MLRPFQSFQITFVICSILFEQMFLFVYIWALPEYFSRWDESRRCRSPYMSLGGGEGGGLKYPLPPMKFSLKATLPQPKILRRKILEKKWHFWNFFWLFCNLGGLDLSQRGLDRDSWSRRQKRVSLDGRENLDSFKKLVSTIEISRSRNLDLVSMSLAKTVLFGRDRDLSRLVEFLWLLVIFVDFSIFFSISTEK